MTKPLSRKKRLTLLAVLALVFIIIAPVVVANSLGYKVGKDELKDVFRVVKTGGIYINSNIASAEIYIDGEYYKNNGLFIKNTLIQELDPEQSYEILFKKEGYNDWRKDITVFESLVTESRVLMIPEKISAKAIYPFVDSLGNGTTTATSTILLDGEIVKTEIILENDLVLKDLPQSALVDGEIPTNSEYRDLIVLFEEQDVYSTSTVATESKGLIGNIFDNNANTANVIEITDQSKNSTTTKDVPEYFIDLGIKDPELLENLILVGKEISWLENGNIILNWINGESVPYYYCTSPDECRDQIIMDWDDDILRFDFFPSRNDVFVILVDNGIYAAEVDDRSQRNIQPVYLQNEKSILEDHVLDFRKNDRDRIVVKDGLVFYELSL
jgi:hypothetical protein